MKRPTLTILDGAFAIHRLSPAAQIPNQLFQEDFFALVKTTEELSIVCSDRLVIAGDEVESGWRCLKVVGPLDFSLTGIIAGLSQVLADAEVSIFAVSTFDTDYLLVRSQQLGKAKDVLRQAGYLIHSP